MPAKKLSQFLFFTAAIAGLLLAIGFYQQNFTANLLGDSGRVQGETKDKLLLAILDVDQGDAILARAPGDMEILIDAGPDNGVVKKLGEYLPFYDRTIELLILTHPHADHTGGLAEVLQRYEVKKILLTGVAYSTADYAAFLKLIKEKNIPAEFVTRPENLILSDRLQLKIIYPDKNFVEQKVSNLNDTSIVVQLVFGSTTAMLTGDMEDEEYLVEKYGGAASAAGAIDTGVTNGAAGATITSASSTATYSALKSDILKVGHHGSNNANDWSFIQAVEPDYVAISVGQDNKFGHPHHWALKNFEKVGAQIFRTDLDGDILFLSDGQKFEAVGN